MNPESIPNESRPPNRRESPWAIVNQNFGRSEPCHETTILTIEQDGEWVARWAERVMVLHDGRIVLNGPTRSVLSQVPELANYAVQPPQIAEVAAADRDCRRSCRPRRQHTRLAHPSHATAPI